MLALSACLGAAVVPVTANAQVNGTSGSAQQMDGDGRTAANSWMRNNFPVSAVWVETTRYNTTTGRYDRAWRYGGARYYDNDFQLRNWMARNGFQAGPGATEFFEYDVIPALQTRGAARHPTLRLVWNSRSGALFYTWDHYQNFRYVGIYVRANDRARDPGFCNIEAPRCR
ncbi:hypothetical protein [Lentzea guizhouensis]|uniref:hypothetical protein n=1 Tax=Lentzea guizhouensis TaxID=1586287 RepID=UPI0012B681C2|nr:hypothetical protein [Lentzea guizhouensis]